MFCLLLSQPSSTQFNSSHSKRFQSVFPVVTAAPPPVAVDFEASYYGSGVLSAAALAAVAPVAAVTVATAVVVAPVLAARHSNCHPLPELTAGEVNPQGIDPSLQEAEELAS